MSEIKYFWCMGHMSCISLHRWYPTIMSPPLLVLFAYFLILKRILSKMRILTITLIDCSNLLCHSTFVFWLKHCLCKAVEHGCMLGIYGQTFSKCHHCLLIMFQALVGNTQSVGALSWCMLKHYNYIIFLTGSKSTRGIKYWAVDHELNRSMPKTVPGGFMPVLQFLQQSFNTGSLKVSYT